MRRAFVDALRLCLAAGLAVVAASTGAVAATVFATATGPGWASAAAAAGTGPGTCSPPRLSPSRGFGASRFASGFPFDQTPPPGPAGAGPAACAGAEAPAFGPRGRAYVGDFYTGTIYVLPRSGGGVADATQLPDAHFGPFDLASLSFGWGGVLYASLWGPGQRAAQPEVVELDPATGAEVRIIARAADGLAGCPGRAVADPINGYLFVPGTCYQSASPPGTIDRISNPGSANPDVSTFARVAGPVAGLAFAPDGALYAERGPGSGSAQVVQVAGPGTVPTSPPTLVGNIRGGAGGGVAVSAVGRRGQASALEALNRQGDVYTLALSDLPAVPQTDVSSGLAPGAGLTTGLGSGVTWHRGCLYFPEGASVERTCGSRPGDLSTIASSLVPPSRAFRPISSDAVDALVAGIVALLVSLATASITNTGADRYSDMFAPGARWLTGLGERWLTGLGERWLTGLRERWLTGPVALVLAGSLLGSFLSPAWGPNLWTLLSFGSIAAAILAGAALPAIFKAFYLRSRGHRQVPYRLKALPAGLVVAALCVAVSRATGFRPGYLYGAVIGIRVGPAPGMADAGSEAEEAAGRCTAVGSTAQLLAGLMAWAAWDSLVKTSSVPGAFFGAVLASDFFAAFFVSAVVGTVAALLPLRHLAGYKLKSWDARVWAAIFGAATFVLVQCILRPTSGPGGRSDVALVTTLGLVLLFCARPVLLRLHLPPLRGPQERAGTAVARPPQSLAPADGLLARGPRDRAGI